MSHLRYNRAVPAAAPAHVSPGAGASTVANESTGRIVALDVARGVAILGTLATNIWIFSHPAGMLGYIGSPGLGDAPAWLQGIVAVLQQLANGKFLGLLTIMFGIGLAIQQESATRRGQRWPGPYLWRAALLLLDGLAHYVLVVEFDVLMGYAVTGAVVAYLIVTSPRTQRLWMWLLGTVHVLVVGLVTWALATGQVTLGDGAPDPNPYQEGSWLDLVWLRLTMAEVFRIEPIFIFGLSVVMFILGANLYRRGLFTPEALDLRRRLMIIGAVALLADFVLGLSSTSMLFLTRYVTAPITAFGVLAMIAELCLRCSPGWGSRRLAEIGRVALSAYVLQNVIASILFYGWGLGLNQVPDPVRPWVTMGAWSGIVAMLFLTAHLWLQRFSRGPLEWAWTASHRLLTGGTRESAASRRRPRTRTDRRG